ncbi:MAG TPA: ABC transporter permease [Planctomycetes bacterium]|nr:ABC transporter permease [Planctomycetota bacterium]
MNALLHLAAKDLRVLSRDRFALFWIFAFPLMYALFFGAIFGDSGGGSGRARVKLALVDEARSDASARLVAALAAHESLEVPRLDGEGEGTERPVRLDALEEARAAVKRGEALAYLRIPAGFEISPFALFGGGGDDAPHLELGIDPSRSAEAGMLQGVLMETVFGGLGESFQDRDRMKSEIAKAREEVDAAEDLSGAQKLVLQTFFSSLERLTEEVSLGESPSPGDGEDATAASGLLDLVETVDVTRETGRSPRSAFEITFPSSMMWGVMSVALGFAITLVRERTNGTLLRLRIAPIGRAELLGGKALACFAACFLVLLFLTGFGVVALGVHVESPGLLLLAMASSAFCFTGLMMTVSVLGKTEQAVAGASWGLMMPFAMIGGGMIPLIAMPAWLATLSDFSFFKWGILALEGAIWRGFTLPDMLGPCAILIAIGLAFFGIGLAVFRRSMG